MRLYLAALLCYNNKAVKSALWEVKGIRQRTCGYGGIGRRARFRFWWATPCRFKSCYPHWK